MKRSPLLALAASLFSGCDRPPVPMEKPRAVIVLMLDTVRADRLSAYGYGRETTPNLKALAARGTLFEEAQSAASWTVPAVASVFTGLFPSEHGAIIEGAKRISEGQQPTYYGFTEELATLPQSLQGLGYRSYARIANPLLALPCFRKGFEAFVVGPGGAEGLVDSAIRRLNVVGEDPFFFYLHFMDAHVPLEPPDELLMRFLPEGVDLERAREARTWSEHKRVEDLEEAGFRDFRAWKVDFYDASLAHMDAQIGRLFDDLEQRGILEDTLIVVLADHGEEFWDHAEIQRECYDVAEKDYVGCCHGHSMFQELLRVPLIFAGPNVAVGKRIEERVRAIDIGATIYQLAGGSPADSGSDARQLGESVSLVPLMRGARPRIQEFLSESITRGNELKAIVDGDGFKLIRATNEAERDLLFDLRSDPLEQVDLLAAEPERAEQLRAVLDARVRGMASRRKRGAVAGADQEQALKDLGYAGGGGPEEDD